MALDPVCGMTVDPARAAGQCEHDGATYYFCSKGCLAKFAADPKKYLSGTREPMHAPAPSVISIGSLKKSTQHPAPGTQHPAPSTQHPAPSTQHPAPVLFRDTFTEFCRPDIGLAAAALLNA